MPIPTRPDHPLLVQQEMTVSRIKALEAALEQARDQLKHSVETAPQSIPPDKLEEWATYLYWCGDSRISLAWLAQAVTGDPVYQSLKGRFAPITTGICCAFCNTPLVFASREALACAKWVVDSNSVIYCLGCRPSAE